ncbi:MAG: S1 RNA-binding domain-containing protein [Nanohaloarchaea archaeon]|nr:S1 RNA-binding domain-containing protein [Candidatus Nanohaloarchaea archaeon]
MQSSKNRPKVGEIIIAEVISINPNSIYVKLEEYNMNGMIHVTELSTSWVKDIRKIAKKGQKLVLKVLPSRGDGRIASLSLKRVKPSQKREKLEFIKNEKRAEKILDFLIEKLELKDNKEDIKKITDTLIEYYESLYNAFSSISAEGADKDFTKDIGEKWSKEIEIIAKEKIRPKILTIRGNLTIKNTSENGLKIIKKALNINNPKIKIAYISAPKYMIEIEGKNYADMEKELAKTIESITDALKSNKGECTFAKV